MTVNPYAGTQADISDVPDYGYQDPAYVAGNVPAPYDLPGDPYADHTRPRIGSTPDPMRTQSTPIRSYRVNPQAPDALWQQLDADKAQRESVGNTREQWTEMIDPSASAGANRWAPNPRATPPAPGRATSDLAPTNYRYRRNDPQNGGTPRRFNGDHMSMADHRRMESELFGVMPRTSRASSQRLDILPWGTNVVNQNQPTTYPNATQQVTESPLGGGTRAYRLG